MIYRADGLRTTAGSADGTAPEDPPSLACRVVQIALTIYLTPVILIVLGIGGTAVVSARLARVASRMISRQPVEPVGPTLDLNSNRAVQKPHLASRTGRSRVL